MDGNSDAAVDDYLTMQCTIYREAISARLDGEPLGMSEHHLDAHLDTCPHCTAWADAAAGVTRRARLTPAPRVPDLTASVLAALPDPRRREARRQMTSELLRVALLGIGVAQAVLAWPTLAFGGGAMAAPMHMTHETGAWNLAVSAAFFGVAAAPRLAAGALPFLGTFAALLTVLTSEDLAAGRVPVERAVGHLLLLAGVSLVAVLAWRGRRRRTVPAVTRDRVTA
jgi:predicted anti-sigma-YlaC factor YlaD